MENKDHDVKSRSKSENEILNLLLDLVNSSTFQQLAKRKKRAIITIEEPNVSLVYASENVKVSTIENEEEESSKTGMYFRGFFFFNNVLH